MRMLAAGRPVLQRAVARLTGTPAMAAGSGSLAARITGAADGLAEVLAQAAARGLVAQPAISNTVHELRGWAFRVDHGIAAPTPATDATGIIAYVRGLPDHQLLALLTDLPWARLDALLDAVQASATASSRVRNHP